MEHLFVVESLAELQTVPPDSGQYIQVAGHTAPGDGGGGLFCWTPTAAVTNRGTVVSSDHSVAGHWRRLYSGAIDVRWFGALGNGADDTTALQSALDTAADGATVVVPSGLYRVLRPLKLHHRGRVRFGAAVCRPVGRRLPAIPPAIKKLGFSRGPLEY